MVLSCNYDANKVLMTPNYSLYLKLHALSVLVSKKVKFYGSGF